MSAWGANEHRRSGRPGTQLRAAGGGLVGEGGTAVGGSFSERVYALVRLVPRGRIVSYGGAAALLGQPRAVRGVGGALAALPHDTTVPWWRVVNRNGEISIKGPLHGAAIQRMLLEREGVRFGPTGRIDWTEFGWAPVPDDIPAELVR